MKKYFLFIICTAIAAIACNKEPVIDTIPEGNDIHTVILNATLPATKIDVDLSNNGKVTWSNTDKIAVYNTNGDKFEFSIKSGAGSSNATFECSSFSGEIDDIAVYPYEWAGDIKGQITIPEYRERTDVIPAVMASKIESGSGTEVNPLYFNSLMAVIDFTLADIPAYACALKVWSKTGAQLNGSYTVNSDCTGFDSVPTGNTAQIIYFPYKTAYGSDASVKVYVPAPAYAYTDLAIRVLDGDEDVIEGTGKVIPAKNFSGIDASAYLVMPQLNIRSMIGNARDKFVKVEGVKWAKGNLRAWKSGTNGEGWQTGWNVYSNQWESQYMLIDDDGKALDGSSENFTLNSALYKEGSLYTHWDYFSWGTLSRTSRVHNVPITSSESNFEISGKIFSMPNKKGDIATTATELSGDDRWLDIGTFQSDNSVIVGDLAFWASKGQFRMPKKSELNKLYAKNYVGVGSNYAHMQAGYYMVGDKVINGILFTSCPSWETTTYVTTAIELNEADIESGLFLPKIGERTANDNGTTYNSTGVKYFNSWGSYWSGTYGGRSEGYEDCAVHIFFTSSNAMNYGYTSKPSNTISGQTILGNAIRPVLVD